MQSSIDNNNREITDDEANLYDRQIRLWGVRSQKLIRKANVLCIGLSGLGSEAIKNIVLSGINSLTVIDHLKVTENDSMSNIFTRHKFGVNRAKAAEAAIKTLNPMVEVKILEWNITQKLNDEETILKKLFQNMDVVLVTNQSKELMIKIDNLCQSIHERRVKFYAACNWGFYGFSFSNLGKNYKYIAEEIVQKEIDFNEEPQKKKQKKEEKANQAKNEKVIEIDDTLKTHSEKTIDFVPLSLALSVKSGKYGVGLTKRTSPVFILTHIMLKFYTKFERFPESKYRSNDIEELKNLAKTVIEELDVGVSFYEKLDAENCWENVFGELSPVCAIIGGVVGQDIIRSITGQDPPIKNFFLFDGLTFTGIVESIGK